MINPRVTQIVTILAEGQLDGKINLQKDNGTHFTIEFKLANDQ